MLVLSERAHVCLSNLFACEKFNRVHVHERKGNGLEVLDLLDFLQALLEPLQPL